MVPPGPLVLGPALEKESTVEPDDRHRGGDVVLSDAEDHRIERIRVWPGSRLNYQRYERRMENTSRSTAATSTMPGPAG
jgi:hypothetical protein